MSKHLTHFCYPIKLMLHQHLNSHVAYPGIPSENSNHTQWQHQHLPSYPIFRLLKAKSDKSSSPDTRFLTSIPLELHLAPLHCARITEDGYHT